jgi:acetolactate synthase-1/2/3 large subunit
MAYRPTERTRARAAAVRERIARGLAAQDRALEQGLLDAIRAALPLGAVNAWDMTILGYWAAAHFPALAPRRFLYPLGSGTLGYAFPAAIGAQVALPDAPALAVVGDGGALYGLQELAAARQQGIAATLLIVDDGRYGILREYQLASFGAPYAVDLGRPDLAAVCAGYGVPTRISSPERLTQDLDWGLRQDGPAAIVLPAELTMWEPTA